MSVAAGLAACSSAYDDSDTPATAPAETVPPFETMPKRVRVCPTLDAVSVGRTGWASAADSAACGVISQPKLSFACLADAGCPRAPALLPVCPEGVDAIELDVLVSQAHAHFGKTVVVRGELVPFVGLTAAYAEAGCFNEAMGELVLRRKTSLLALVDRGVPGAFYCGGDDSFSCCGFDAGDINERPSVAVTGTLVRRAPELLVEPMVYHLAAAFVVEPKLCWLRPKADEVLHECAAAEARPLVARCAAGDRDPFDVGALRCACHAGRLSCTPDRSACFRSGSWYPEDGEPQRISRSSRQLFCKSGRWQVRGEEHFAALGIVRFRPGEIRIQPGQSEAFERMLKLAGQPGQVLRSHPDPSEGARGRELAEKRARVVLDAIHSLRPYAQPMVEALSAPRYYPWERGARGIGPFVEVRPAEHPRWECAHAELPSSQ